MLRLSVALSLALAVPADQAFAQETPVRLSVLLVGADGVATVKIAWREERNTADRTFGQPLAVPRTVYLVTTPRNAPPGVHVAPSLHRWWFGSSFGKDAGIGTALRLQTQVERRCPNSRVIESKAAPYGENANVVDWLSGAIYFGYLYQLCTAEGLGDSARTAKNITLDIYDRIAAFTRERPSFKGGLLDR
jgi:hypothetical protein